jgi:hypothetical protein
MEIPSAWKRSAVPIAAALVLLTVAAVPARAQYFGQNKVQYEKFDFQVLKTDHFDIYYYPEEREAAAQVGRMAERWHTRLSRVLQHTLSGRQPVILYASHPHFEQTNVIEGFLGEGTGGVTEGALRRVTLPMAGSLAETDHVLGHELVHAFQYDMLGPGGEGLPLWFIEGMAEYLSLGPRDAQTAMWLRDAALNEHLPKIKDLNDPRYFPYRFGHAFWAYMGARWGDSVTGLILQAVAADSAGGRSQGPYIDIIEQATGRSLDVLSDEWHNAIRASFASLGTAGTSAAEAGLLIGKANERGGLNVGPSLSPDGTRIAFLSSLERLSINLYVADAKTGKVIRKLIETAADPHFESLQFLQSAGAWDPTGHKLAIAAIRKGRPVLAIVDADRGGVQQEIAFPDLGEIFQPTWSPDGKSIAFSAQVGGFTDLFVRELEAGTTTRLTQDQFADLQPAWSPDGRRIAFVTDRHTTDLRTLAFNGYTLATIDPATKAIEPIETGLKGDAVNPQWGAADGALYFIGDAGGRQNVYRMDLASKAVTRLTDEPAGIAGITPLSPALSIAGRTPAAGVSIFRDGGYDVRVLQIAGLGAGLPVTPSGDAALLPPARQSSEVAQYLGQPATGLPPASTATAEAAKEKSETYKPGLTLVGIGQQVGVTTFGGVGSYFGGGISLLFSDTLGNHLLGVGAEINGGLKDIGAGVNYVNRTHRWNWGVFGQRAPYLSGTAREFLDRSNNTIVQQIDRFRETDHEIGAMTAYPLSRVSRVEFAASVRHIGFSREIETAIFDGFSGELISDQVQKVDTLDALKLGQFSAAFVRDTAIPGATSPLRGTRLRVEAMPTYGDLQMVNVTADYRRYVMPVRPITFAGRLLHAARYGGGSEDDRLQPLFLGYSTLVRGYDVGTFRASECTADSNSSCPEFDRLLGSRLLVFNGEVRAPLVGLFKRNIEYGALPVEVFGFFDAGVAWTQADQPSFAGGSRDWVTRAGAGARVNVFGYAIAEFNIARPISRPTRGWLFVFNLRPGW